MKTKLIFLPMLLVASLIGASHPASGQNWDEWFHQEWTQGEYHKQQIGGLWLFLEKVSDGLQVVGKGLTTISNITNGELNLHRDFFGSRQNVNPSINNAIDFIEVINFQMSIVRQMNKLYAQCRNNPSLSADEILYIERVHRNFLILTDANISELLKILRPGDLAMSDDERMDRLDKIYDEMKDQRSFVNAFSNEAQMLSWERQRELNDLNWTRSQYETF